MDDERIDRLQVQAELFQSLFRVWKRRSVARPLSASSAKQASTQNFAAPPEENIETFASAIQNYAEHLSVQELDSLLVKLGRSFLLELDGQIARGARVDPSR